MKKRPLLFFMLLLLTAAVLPARANNANHASSATQTSAPQKARRFNQYIWNGEPSMHYHRVLAQVSIPAKPNGTVVIICPGGSYHHLDVLNEGLPTQKWFNQQGATAILLRYRTANRAYHYPAMMQDIQRMIQLVRENPAQYAANPQRLGVIGYSAGGHLVAWAGAFGDRTNELEKIGIRTSVSLRPDFVIPVYPVVTMDDDIGHVWSQKSLLGKKTAFSTTPTALERREQFSLEKQITADIPPTYLVACHDDPVVIFENSVRLAAALEAAGTDYRFTEYEWGGHGFGMKNGAFMKTFHWNEPLLAWLKERGFL